MKLHQLLNEYSSSLSKESNDEYLWEHLFYWNASFFSDFPVALLRNVSYFCKSGGLQGMANAFLLAPEDLPPSLAHALISILCNVKLWLNYRAVPQLFTPVRTNALRYMCELSDAELRQQHPRQIGKIKEVCCIFMANYKHPRIFGLCGGPESVLSDFLHINNLIYNLSFSDIK